MDLYAEEILDHYKHPRHYGHLDQPSITYHDSNPFCGDEIELELRIEDGRVADVAFTGHGCAISRAAASMMSEEIIGKTLEELRGWNKESIVDLLGIEVGPVRIKCALLPLKALKAAVWGLAEDDDDSVRQVSSNRSDGGGTDGQVRSSSQSG